MLLPSFVNPLLHMLYTSVVRGRRVFVIAVDVEVRSIRPNVIANLIMREF